MKKSVLILLVAVLFTIKLWAQGECGYLPDQEYLNTCKNKKSIQNKRLTFLKEYSLKNVQRMQGIEYTDGEFTPIMQNENEDGAKDGTPEENKRTVPIVAHILRRSNGTGGLSADNLDASIGRANNFYAAMNMHFVLCETRYIDSDNLYDHYFNNNDDNVGNSNASYNKLNVIIRNVPQKMNIYFAPNATTSWAWRPNTHPRSQHVFMRNAHALNASTLSHEIGHWFGLLHTHSGGNELVDGSNCSTAGDFICDTPADPNLSNKVSSSCQYVGGSNIVDANGMTYHPDARNIMSYSIKACRNRFSEEQIYAMQAAYLGIETDRGYTFSFCPAIPDFSVAGIWKNKTDGEEDITTIFVSSDDNKIQAFSKCVPIDCEWKIVPLNKTDLTYQAKYEEEFVSRKLIIRPISKDEIELTVYTDYHDSRQDKSDTYFMTKLNFSFAGTWNKKGKRIKGVQKLIVSNGDSTIQIFGKRRKKYCDWETAALSKSGLIYKATYTKEHTIKTLSIVPVNEEEIKLIVATTYRKSRKNRTDTYYMKKKNSPVIPIKTIIASNPITPEKQ